MRKFLNVILVIAMVALMMMPVNAFNVISYRTDGGSNRSK